MADFLVSATLVDGDGDEFSIEQRVVAADMAAAITRAQAWAEAIDPLTLGSFSDVKVTQDVDISGWSVLTGAGGGDREIKGRFLFTAVGGYKTRISIGAFDVDNYTTAGGDVTVDVVTPDDPGAFVNEVIDNGWADGRFTDITAFRRAYEAFD